MVCLDSDLLVSFLRRQPQALQAMEKLNGMEKLSTTIVTVCELFEGAASATDPIRASLSLDALLSQMTILDLDYASARIFGQARFSLRRKGMPLEDMDLLIGSIAYSHGEELITRNRKHFERVPGLKIKTW